MRKIVYLCGMMLLCLNVMAQIDPYDRNWDTLFIEDFSVPRSWSNTQWQDSSVNLEHVSLWRCFSHSSWPSGVTTKESHRQAYQPKNAVFGTDGTMKLVAEFKTADTMWCGLDYKPAPHPFHCDSIHKQHKNIHYHSGTIETIDPVGYGYYEIKCKMPIHDGANTSFWFWSSIGGTYNEIDVLEHCTNLCEGDLKKNFLSGIWYNPIGTNYHYILDSLGHVVIPGAHRYAERLYTIPNSSPALDNYHTFGCLWLPERMAVFCDGIMVTECTEPSHIPPHSMRLKITHKEDEDAWDSIANHWWNINDTVTVDYVKAFRLKTDCNTDATIRNVTVFSNYDYCVKHTIRIGSNTGVLTIPDNIIFTMRAVESIIIDGALEVPIGTSMTLITQECPYCSDD